MKRTKPPILKMNGRVEVITPAKAERFLASSAGNRPIKSDRVALYCRDRIAGDWQLNHHAIAFDTQGRLVDGHHRLHMVKRTGLPTEFFVVFNVPKANTLYIDNQLPRSVRDALHMAQKGDYSGKVISTANVLRVLPREVREPTTRGEIEARLKAFAEPLAFVEERLNGLGITRVVRALAVRAWPHIGRARLADWCHVLSTGFTASDDPDEDAAGIVYRNWLLHWVSKCGRNVELERYQKGQVALRAFNERRSLIRLTGTKADLFPLDENDA